MKLFNILVLICAAIAQITVSSFALITYISHPQKVNDVKEIIVIIISISILFGWLLGILTHKALKQYSNGN